MRFHFRPAILGSATAAVLVTGALLGAALVFPAAASAATAPITFALDMFSGCVGGHAAPEATVSLVWRDSQGALKAQGTTLSSLNTGYWTFCGSDTSAWLTPGDAIKADDGISVRKYTVPNFSIFLNRVTNRVTGTGPAHRTPRVCSTFAMFGDYEKCYPVRVGDDGTWSFNPHRDIQGGIYASLIWTSPKGDHLYAETAAPLLRVTLERAAFSGQTAPRRDLEVGDSTSGGSSHVMSDAYGNFSGHLVDSLGHLAPVAVGDHITAPSLSSDADWIVPQIDAAADKATDVVSGKCWNAGTSDGVVLFDVTHSGHSRGGGITETDADGNFSIDLGEDAGGFFDDTNVIAGDRVLVQCRQTTGDFAQLKIVVN
jgi:hypothetical protein